jgi:COPII coat assembly protein SEC16
MNTNVVGHLYQMQQQYGPIAEQPPFERSSLLQSSRGLPDGTTSPALHAHAAHAQPPFDPYRPATLQSSNADSSHMYPKPSLASAHDRTTTYSAYQPVANSSLSVPQPGYQAYSALPRQLNPQIANTSLGTKDNSPDPTQATALYRPKTTNAYDPPIPPPKPSRHFIGQPGSSRVFSPTGVTQTYAAQEARHVTYQTNASSLPPSGRYAPQAHTPSVPPTTSHPPSIAHSAANVSPPRREPHSRLVPGRSMPAETSMGPSPYSVPLSPESPYSHQNIFDHTYTPSVPSMNAGAENISTNKLGHKVAVPRESEAPVNRAEGHEFQPEQRVGFAEREHSSDTSMSGNQYDHPDAGIGFAQHSITNSGYPSEVPRSTAAPIHTSSYEPSSYAPALERTQSPSSSSVHSARSSRSRDLVSPPPSSVAARPASHTPVSAGPSAESGPVVSRVSSPGSIRSWKSPHVPSSGHYAPARSVEPFISTARDRSMSNSSLVSSHSSLASDPYAPSRRTQNSSEASTSMSLHQTSRVPVHDTDRSHGQTLILPTPTHAPYAPSPSLLGSNDPLGRTSSRAPVVSFGFGGKLVLCFHGSNTLNTGFDIALSSRQTTGIQMRPLHAVIPESALDHISASFPGPLFCDPGSQTGLVRTAIATQSKNNKAKVIEYLEGRAGEISRGLGYLSQGSPERRQAEGKHTLVRLLKVLLEHDGHLSGR